MFKRILVPTDGSQFSQDAASWAVALAKDAAAHIIAFYAMQPYVPFFSQGIGDGFPVQSNFNKPVRDKEAQEILGFVENLCWRDGVNCTKVIKQSNVIYAAIIEAALENSCDLICMAAHGRAGNRAILLGSETSKVLTHSSIPALIYR